MGEPRIALCHEWLTTYGGSEQVAGRIAAALGIRDVFTFAARPETARRVFPAQRIRISPWGTSAFAQAHWQRLLPVMPYAWSQLDLEGFDAVVTSSHACTNAIRPPAGIPVVSYCHTPMRYAWNWRSEIRRIPGALRPVWPLAAAAFRRADRRWARRVTTFVANSKVVAARIRRFYRRDAEVVHPPVDLEFWTPDASVQREGFFLVAGRFVAYKQQDLAVRAAVEAGVPLVLAGGGPELPRLRELAGPQTSFVEQPSDEELRDLYRRTVALVNPGVEDFGLTMVEAQACGTPVIALAAGGAVESVVNGTTGVLYEEPEDLAGVLRAFDNGRFDATAIRANAERFDGATFEAAIRRIVHGVLH